MLYVLPLYIETDYVIDLPEKLTGKGPQSARNNRLDSIPYDFAETREKYLKGLEEHRTAQESARLNAALANQAKLQQVAEQLSQLRSYLPALQAAVRNAVGIDGLKAAAADLQAIKSQITEIERKHPLLKILTQ